MKTIVKGNKNVCKILGEQTIKPDEQYRLNKYLLRLNCDDCLLLHNVITGHIVLLSKDESDILYQLPCEYAGIQNDLIKHYFLVPIAFDEYEIVNKLRWMLKRILRSRSINGFTILTTTNCNAHCSYCYESKLSKVNMNAKVTMQLVDFIKRRSNKGPVSLHWFGGEPLMNSVIIDRICDSLQKESIQYESIMTSNGSLFTEDLVDKAQGTWHLKKVQISLDGTEKLYNEIKSYRDRSTNYFWRVISNIHLLLDHGIRVAIRMNLDQNNVQDLRELVAFVNEEFPVKDNLYVYVHIVIEDLGFSPIPRDKQQKEKLYFSLFELNEYLKNANLQRPNETPRSLRLNRCMADDDGTVIVYPDGKLLKCETVSEEDAFGHIALDGYSKEKLEKYKEKYEHPYCKECELYPSCILLRNCPGIDDQPVFACHHDVDVASQELKYYYDLANSSAEVL